MINNQTINNDNIQYIQRNIKKVFDSSASFLFSYAFQGCSKLLKVSFPNCTTIGACAFSGCHNLSIISFGDIQSIEIGAFTYCYSLTEINFPNVSIIPDDAFGYCVTLSSVSFPNCTIIGQTAFEDCYSLTTVSFPSCMIIGEYAFGGCESLTTINFPNCTTIGDAAFGDCYSLTTISFPNVISIGNYAFGYCSLLTTVSFPNVTRIGSSAFEGCYSLATVSFPRCTTIGEYAFQRCQSLTTVNFPNCTTIGDAAFGDCGGLSSVCFPSCTTIGAYAFYYCSHLRWVDLENVSSVVSLGDVEGHFYGTPILNNRSAFVCVAPSLYDAFCSDSMWTSFSSRIISLVSLFSESNTVIQPSGISSSTYRINLSYASVISDDVIKISFNDGDEFTCFRRDESYNDTNWNEYGGTFNYSEATDDFSEYPFYLQCSSTFSPVNNIIINPSFLHSNTSVTVSVRGTNTSTGGGDTFDWVYLTTETIRSSDMNSFGGCVFGTLNSISYGVTSALKITLNGEDYICELITDYGGYAQYGEWDDNNYMPTNGVMVILTDDYSNIYIDANLVQSINYIDIYYSL